MVVTLNVNGKAYKIDVDPEMPLLWALRDVIGLTGTKYGCGIHLCWACCVMVDGQAEKSCDLKAAEMGGRKITTIEGLSKDRSHPLQKAWIAEQVPQCGYCQSGMIMRAVEVLNEHSRPGDGDINSISNLCLCGTYNRVRAAVKRAANGG
jgi:isoquinoline 1-oxidoreductase subunit alpha